jgi:hypothetical protein
MGLMTVAVPLMAMGILPILLGILVGSVGHFLQRQAALQIVADSAVGLLLRLQRGRCEDSKHPGHIRPPRGNSQYVHRFSP